MPLGIVNQRDGWEFRFSLNQMLIRMHVLTFYINIKACEELYYARSLSMFCKMKDWQVALVILSITFSCERGFSHQRDKKKSIEYIKTFR